MNTKKIIKKISNNEKFELEELSAQNVALKFPLINPKYLLNNNSGKTEKSMILERKRLLTRIQSNYISPAIVKSISKKFADSP